jgi:hypothetical protein
MKKFYSILIAIGTLTVFASVAAAQSQPWDKVIAKKRFIVLLDFNNQAVRDNETGLVWEQSPGTGNFGWAEAQSVCNTNPVGNRLGWRLPTIQELASLIDPSVPPPGPTLPVGHPFSNVQSDSLNLYWSATTFAGNTSVAWGVPFYNGGVNLGDKSASSNRLVWCVRGGQGVDPQ